MNILSGCVSSYVTNDIAGGCLIKLLRHLHNIDFQYMLPMDGNRAEDGIDLRYRFGYEKEYEVL